MVTITLTNNNPLSPNKFVYININKGEFCFDNKKKFPLRDLFSQTDFTHPLLSETCTHPKDNIYYYEYNDVDEMLRLGIYIYTRLLQSADPLSCVFKIKPSPSFVALPKPKNIFFSIEQNKKAEESISIEQLESLVSDFLGCDYKYSEDVLIKSNVTIDDLPPAVNGDVLYATNEGLVNLLKAPRDYSPYEIRYISPEIGLGVFCKERIKKGTFISFYTGIKRTFDPDVPLHFTFRQKRDALMMLVDASQHGNITRFCNHAPKKVTNPPTLVANVHSDIYKTNGLEFVLYYTKRDIYPGEQMLIDYGKAYFDYKTMYGFLENGKLRIINFKNMRAGIDKKEKIKHLRKMASHDIKKAQSFLLFRTLTLCLILIAILETFVLVYK